MIKLFRFLPVILFSLMASQSSASATKHSIAFGGALGIVYSPDSITVVQGDTIEWHGDFSMHPLSSTTIPAGAPGWHAGTTDTIFDYIPGLPGAYHYHCDIHFSFGMVGVFIVQQTVPQLLLPADNATGVSVNPTFVWSSVTNASLYQLEYSPTIDFSSPLDRFLADTAVQLGVLNQETKYYWHVRAFLISDTGIYSGTDSFTTGVALPPSTLIIRGWNILSVPFRVGDARPQVLYPHSISHAFIYQNGYVSRETLSVGEGFWLKFSQDQNDSISGLPVSIDTVDVTIGWNMVGSISTTIAAANISSIPPNILTSRFFGYTQGYQPSDSIKSGKGYWVKVDQSGQLVLSDQPSANSASRIRIVPTGELPPGPPSGTQDERPLPRGYVLEQNYPNPFNPATAIKYQLPVTSRVRLGVYNLQGELVSKLVDGVQEAGYKSVEWNAAGFASGIYFYRLDATSVLDPGNSVSQVRKMLLVR